MSRRNSNTLNLVDWEERRLRIAAACELFPRKSVIPYRCASERDKEPQWKTAASNPQTRFASLAQVCGWLPLPLESLARSPSPCPCSMFHPDHAGRCGDSTSRYTTWPSRQQDCAPASSARFRRSIDSSGDTVLASSAPVEDSRCCCI